MKSKEMESEGNSVKSEFRKNRAGRPKSLNSEEFEKLLKLYYSRPLSIRQLAKMFGVSRMTVWRMVNSNSIVWAGERMRE